MLSFYPFYLKKNLLLTNLHIPHLLPSHPSLLPLLACNSGTLACTKRSLRFFTLQKPTIGNSRKVFLTIRKENKFSMSTYYKPTHTSVYTNWYI